jgi:phage gpG-like protein
MARGNAKRAENNAKRRRPSGDGVWNLRMETTFGPLLDAVEDIAFAQSRWEPAFEDLAERIERGAARAFKSGTGPDGHKWRPLTEDYGRRKEGRGTLVLSGKLRAETKRSKAVKVLTGDRLVYEVDRDYATTHQFGKFPSKRKGKHGGFPGARVRNYILWGDELKEAFADSLNKYGEQRRAEILREAAKRGR